MDPVEAFHTLVEKNIKVSERTRTSSNSPAYGLKRPSRTAMR